jgi:hypothetical protein
VFAQNAPEWPFIVIGCIMACVEGGVQPGFAIVFSSILGVSSINRGNVVLKLLKVY